MAGSHPAFNAGVFREAIRSAMTMGLPNNPTEQATFRWSTVKDYAIDDPAQNPYDWTAEPTTTTTRADVQVPVAVEFAARGTDVSAMAQFDTSRVTLTVLDDDYALIKGADIVLLGGNTYRVDFVAPPMGLFEVTVYQIFASAEDES